MITALVETSGDIVRRSIAELQSSTRITQMTRGSKARSLLEALAREVVTLEESTLAAIMLSFVGSAEGYYLDFIGDIFGISREASAPAEVRAGAQVMRVSAPASLKFGDLNGGAPIVVPAGTRITSVDNAYRYQTVGTVTLRPLDTESFLHIQSMLVGSGSNTPAGTLTQTTFTGYTQSAQTKLVLYNTAAISNGRDIETDSFYRNRVMNEIRSIVAANEVAITMAALSVPGVADIAILNLNRGVGTADLIVDSVTGEVSEAMRQQVQLAINEKSALGVHIVARAPRLIGLEVSLSVRLRSGTSEVDKSQAVSAIRASIFAMVRETPLGGSISVNAIAALVLGSSGFIVDIGTPNKPVDEVVLWRESAMFGSTPVVVTEIDYLLAPTERLTMKGVPSKSVKVVVL